VRALVSMPANRRARVGGGGAPRDTLTRDPLMAFERGHEIERAGFGNPQKQRSREAPPPPTPARRREATSGRTTTQLPGS